VTTYDIVSGPFYDPCAGMIIDQLIINDFRFSRPKAGNITKLSIKGVYHLRKLHFTFIVAIVLIMAMSASVAWAGHKIQDKRKGTIKLESTDASKASGTVKFELTNEKGGFHKLTIDLQTKDLKPKSGYVYQLWLKDADTDTAEAAGAFQTSKKGKGTLVVKTSVPHFSQYDEAVVTKEKQHDVDPTPSGIAVLQGDLDH